MDCCEIAQEGGKSLQTSVGAVGFMFLKRNANFLGTMLAHIPPDDADYVGLPNCNASVRSHRGPQPSWTDSVHMTVLADLRVPMLGASGLASIQGKGYIQCRRCY